MNRSRKEFMKAIGAEKFTSGGVRCPDAGSDESKLLSCHNPSHCRLLLVRFRIRRGHRFTFAQSR